MMQDDLRAQLIRQFPAEVVEAADPAGNAYYVCPTCKRAISKGTDKCSGCAQVLSWEHIHKEETANGVKKATLEFEVSSDFSKGDCRKCPLSYIGREQNENVYECPLKMRANCKLVVS